MFKHSIIYVNNILVVLYTHTDTYTQMCDVMDALFHRFHRDMFTRISE